MTAYDPPVRWRHLAECRDADTNVFFPEWGEHADPAAFGMCEVCPARARCARYAVENELHAGVWGGMTPETRKLVRTGRLTLSPDGIPLLPNGTPYHP